MNSVPEAKIICDSISPDGIRLTTMEVKIHRFVLAELNTHRVFSRNSASSRAIPVKKLLERVKTDPAMPVFWGKNQAGMGAAVELDTDEKQMAINTWLIARDQAVSNVERLLAIGVHKQLTNRLLEPWLWHTAIISSTEWTNFFGQRCSLNPETGQPYAQPEMHFASMAMQKAFYESTPNLILPEPSRIHGWHLPYIQPEDIEWAQYHCMRGIDFYSYVPNLLKMISAGRCARVSYLTHDGKRDPQEDINLSEKLKSATPMHGSPFEHVATPSVNINTFNIPKGNFRGWHQFRHSFNNETVKEFVPNYQT